MFDEPLLLLQPTHTITALPGQVPMDPKFFWSPSGQWLALLVCASKASETGAVRLLVIDPAEGRVHSLRGQQAGLLPMTMRALTASSQALRPKCVWAPDESAVWVGSATVPESSDMLPHTSLFSSNWCSSCELHAADQSFACVGDRSYVHAGRRIGG